jgi:hypothetical protein
MNYVLVTRLGKIGDLLMLEPTIEALYYKHAPCKIILRTTQEYVHVLREHPLVSDIVVDNPSYYHKFMPGLVVEGKAYPITEKTQIGFVGIPAGGNLFIYDFQDVIEKNPGIHGVDAFAQHAQVTLLHRTPTFGSYLFDTPDKKRVVVQLRKDESRTLLESDLPMDLLEANNAYFISEQMDATEYLKLIQGADIFIGPDSSGLHIAHAAGVRNIIGIYDDAFSIGTRKYPNMVTLRKSDPKEIIRNAIEIALRDVKYPQHINKGNACEWGKNLALQFCKGKGLDVGSNHDEWALPGAVASDEVTQKFHLGPYDFIHSSHCLEHVVEWQAYLKLWEASVKPGGTVFLYLPHSAMEYWRPGREWVGHWHVWSPEPLSLVKWLNENTKLKVQEYSTYPDSCWSFYIAAKKEST